MCTEKYVSPTSAIKMMFGEKKGRMWQANDTNVGLICLILFIYFAPYTHVPGFYVKFKTSS